MLINEKGKLLGFELTPGNTDDHQPLWKISSKEVFGSLYGDRGYISKDLREMLKARGINFCYKVRKNMPPLEVSVSDEVLLKKRVIADFQVSGDLLYVVNAKGFFSINPLYKPKGDSHGYDQFLCAIPLQASRPMSLAVGKGFACVLATPRDLH